MLKSVVASIGYGSSQLQGAHHSHSPGGHVSHTGFGNGAVCHSLDEGVAPEAARIRHGHVQPGEGGSNTGMLGTPVGDDPALVAKLSLEKAVQSLAVGGSVRVVNPVVRAHDVGGPGMDRLLEGPVVVVNHCWVEDVVTDSPEIHLVNGLVVNVGRDGLDVAFGVSVGFLLVTNEVL